MTPEDCEKFKQNPNINPLTNRKISSEGALAKKIHKECSSAKVQKTKETTPPLNKNNCLKWKLDKTKNPLTGRKISTTAKKGIYQQLLKLCNNTIKDTKSSITNAQRDKLINVLKKVLGPILNKGDSTKSRTKFYEIMNKYLEDIQPCIQNYQGKLYLFNKKKNPIVYFDKRIGSESVYGVAYLNMGKGLAKLLKFSCKLMAANIKGHIQEIKLLDMMSNLTLQGKTPNMPITYKSLKCTKKCNMPECPKNTKFTSYFVVINELASMDIQTWFRKKYDVETYESILIQLLFSIYCFHKMGYSHNDAHLGNFLIHEIQPGGYWRYQINDVNIYVPNKGYLLVMWDPGMATKLQNYKLDYERTFNLIINMENYPTYMEKGMKILPISVNTYGAIPIFNIMKFSNSEEQGIMTILDYIKNKIIRLNSIKIDEKPPGYLLNIKPYTLS